MWWYWWAWHLAGGVASLKGLPEPSTFSSGPGYDSHNTEQLDHQVGKLHRYLNESGCSLVDALLLVCQVPTL